MWFRPVYSTRWSVQKTVVKTKQQFDSTSRGTKTDVVCTGHARVLARQDGVVAEPLEGVDWE